MVMILIAVNFVSWWKKCIHTRLYVEYVFLVFSDKATFKLNGTINRHNCRFWPDTNPKWMLQAYTQYPEKLNVWTGILNDVIIGPFFINDNPIAKYEEDMLMRKKSSCCLAIHEIIGDFQHTWFQDGDQTTLWNKCSKLFGVFSMDRKKGSSSGHQDQLIFAIRLLFIRLFAS